MWAVSAADARDLGDVTFAVITFDDSSFAACDYERWQGLLGWGWEGAGGAHGWVLLLVFVVFRMLDEEAMLGVKSVKLCLGCIAVVKSYLHFSIYNLQRN